MALPTSNACISPASPAVRGSVRIWRASCRNGLPRSERSRVTAPAALIDAPPPIIAFHSRADEVNPYLGGAGPRWDLGVEATEAAYAERYGWNGPSIDVVDNVVRHVYRDRAERDRLTTYTLDGRSHGWYGSRDPQHAAQYGTGTTRSTPRR